MTTLTTDQITEIADTLEALGTELETRDWTSEIAQPVVTATAGYLVSVAAMRTPVPQQAYFAPPAYPYQDLLPGADQSVPLSVLVTGSTRNELEYRAEAEGLQVFGKDAALVVTLTGTITPVLQAHCGAPDGEKQYQCGAVIRQQEPRVTPR